MPQQFIVLIAAALALLVMAGVSFLSGRGSLNSIKSKPVGDGQHGTARWAVPAEIGKTFHRVPFHPARWRRGEDLPQVQGLVLGSQGRKGKVTALVDSDDIHCLMIGAAGVGKTAFFLYPNLEYACACGMSFLALDTKGDLARHYGAIAEQYYGYQVSIIDLRNPTRSDGFNFLTLANAYMDQAAAHPDDLAARAKAEKYAKILSKTIINPEGDSFGQNAFFYDSAEGLLTAVILLLAEFLPPRVMEATTPTMMQTATIRMARPPNMSLRLKSALVVFFFALGLSQGLSSVSNIFYPSSFAKSSKHIAGLRIPVRGLRLGGGFVLHLGAELHTL